MPSVYLIKNGEGMYKIGHSQSVENRRKGLQTASASILEIVHEFKSKFASKIEKTLHRRFVDKKLQGEWFSLSAEDENNFLEICKQIHSNLLYLEENKILSDKIIKKIK